MRNPGSFRTVLAAETLMIAGALALPAQPAPSATPTPLVRSPGNAEWAVSLSEARQRASAQQKLIFVEVGRQGCGNCQRMDQLLYPAFDFEALLVPMVPIKVDLDSSEGQALALRYEIDETPSVLVVTPEGRLAFLMQGFQNAPDFYRHIHEQLDAYRRFARKIDAQDVAKLTASEALGSGRELLQRHDPAEALPRLQRVGRAPGATDAMRDEAVELAAAAELELGNPAAAQRTIQKLISSTKDPARQERAELFRAQIPLSANNPAEALKLLQEFRKAYPQSAYAAQVDAIIQRLQEARPR
jgi:tetratricopeptide (TPR) repeat protein